MKNLISAKELLSLPPDADISIFDCRFDLADPGIGRRLYLSSHLPGAVYVSLDGDLCAPLGEHGGRHPLPTVEDMTALFSRLGIVRNRTRVVAYDDSGGCYAARLWWMLRYLGHDPVQVLDGGFAAWERAGGRTVREIPMPLPTEFVPESRPEMLASMEDVRGIGDPAALMDCRAPERFRGEHEPIDPVAGRIPGARNLYWKDTTDEDGVFLPTEELKERFADFRVGAVMYCGSGVTACVNILGYEEAGYAGARLYAGSWSDWISYPENPIEVNRGR